VGARNHKPWVHAGERKERMEMSLRVVEEDKVLEARAKRE